MNILIVDPNCPKPYDNNSLLTGGLGGTESTIIRIANKLAELNTVVVSQHNRIEDYSPKERLYFTGTWNENKFIKSPDIIVFIQKTQFVRQLKNKYPKARKLLWLHNYIKDEIYFNLPDIILYNVEILCVSHTHKTHTFQTIQNNLLKEIFFKYLYRLKIHYIYNPVDIDSSLYTSPIDVNKLVFFSSPHKGIDNVIRLFLISKKHEYLNNLKLYIANPGYKPNLDTRELATQDIVNLGSIPHDACLSQIRNALCVFYPQHSRPETFGLVYAEANAVGTPVLAHDFGSAREILQNQDQILDCFDDTKVIETLKAWRVGGKRPYVKANPEYSLDNVIGQWEKLISQK